MKNMDDPETFLIKLFGSTSRARIVTLLMPNYGRSFYQREIMFETGLSLQATQRELNNLVDLEIVEKRETRNRVYYQVNTKSRIFKPMLEICGAIGVK